jgi:hypothetical protein
LKFSHAKIFVSAFIVAVLILGCGYRPSSKISRDVVGDAISTTVKISTQDPENTVIIKDAVDSAFVSVFHSSLTSKARSDTHLELSIGIPVYVPIQYDASGYVVGYRMSVVLNIIRYHNGLTKTYISNGSYDFAVDPNAVVTDQQRFNAIKLSAQKAIKSFIAQVAADGARAKKSEE